MSKMEFLDILQDYLTENFSHSQIMDISREYEEFFINGQLEGKSEEDICKALGSPKSVAKKLIKEMKGFTKEEINSFMKKRLEILKNSNIANKKTRKFLNLDCIANVTISSRVVKNMIYIVSIILILIGLCMIPVLIEIIFMLIGGSLVNVLGYVLGIIFYSDNSYIATSCIFGSIFLTGLLILGWTIYINIIKYIKVFIVRYKWWVKTKIMYLRENNTVNMCDLKAGNDFNKNKCIGFEEDKEEGDKNE